MPDGEMASERPAPASPRTRPQRPQTPARALLGVTWRLPGVRMLVLQVLLATLLLQAFALALPLATKYLVDSVLQEADPALAGVVGVGIVLAVVAQVATTYLRSLLLLRVQGQLDRQLLTGFASHMFRLPLRYFHDRMSGDMAMRLASVATLRELLTNQTVTATLDGLLLLTYAGVMFFFDVFIATVVLAIILVQITVLVVTAPHVARLTVRNVAAQVELNEYVVQALAGVATVKATGAESHVIGTLSRRIADWTRTTLRQMHFTAVLEVFSTAVRLASPLLVLWIGAVRVLDDQVTLGDVLALTWLASAMAGSLTSLVANAARLQVVRVELGRVGEVTVAPVERSDGQSPPRRVSGGSRLELRDVSFSYEPGARPAVSDVTLTIEPGQRVAIVGATGAGKTTLAWLLLALYQPTSGEIRYDSVPLSDLDVHQLRGRFGVVLQDSFMIGGSIRDNILFSRPDATEQDVLDAARLAEIHDDIERMPHGYGTLIGERGVGLSGGQLQRLAIARALVGRPSVLLLDEATSHLDSRTEGRIVANLRGVSCTQVVIAHRLSTVYDADQIVVLDSGRVVERGVHADLVARGGSYSALVAAQLSSLV